MTVVLIALDDHSPSTAAAEAAKRLFGPSATYLAVNVAKAPPLWAPSALVWGGVLPYAEDPTLSYDVQTEQYQEAADAARDTAKELAADAGLSAAVVVGETGDPVDAIARAAEEHDVDVIVVGASEKNWWHRLFEGSVSKDLIRVAHRPVLVVPSHHHAGHDTARSPEH